MQSHAQNVSTPERSVSAPRAVSGKMKWFNSGLFYGFVLLDDGREALVHGTALCARHNVEGGQIRTPDLVPHIAHDARVSVTVEQTEIGLKVTEVLNIQPQVKFRTPEPKAPTPSGTITKEGVVKWFKRAAYGFITLDDDPMTDAFAHITELEECGFILLEGERVTFQFLPDNNGKGSRAYEVKLKEPRKPKWPRKAPAS